MKLTGGKKWRSKGKKVDNHHQEHHDLFAALRDGRTYNEGDYGAKSTMTAILGRMATYSGKIVKWDEALKMGIDLSPAVVRFCGDAARRCRMKDGFYPVPVPGKTEVFDSCVQELNPPLGRVVCTFRRWPACRDAGLAGCAHIM